MQLSKAARQTLHDWSSPQRGCYAQHLLGEQDLDEATFLTSLDTFLPNLGTQQRKAIIDAAAIAAYHAEVDFPVLPSRPSASADLRRCAPVQLADLPHDAVLGA